MHDAIKT